MTHRWYRVIDPGYVQQLAAARGLSYREIARRTGMSQSTAAKALTGRITCQHDRAVLLVRELTGNPDATEVQALFQPALRVPAKANASSSDANKAIQCERREGVIA